MIDYIPYSANIRFIVAWKGEDNTEETAVVLPDIYLRKHNPDKDKG